MRPCLLHEAISASVSGSSAGRQDGSGAKSGGSGEGGATPAVSFTSAGASHQEEPVSPPGGVCCQQQDPMAERERGIAWQLQHWKDSHQPGGRQQEMTLDESSKARAERGEGSR